MTGNERCLHVQMRSVVCERLASLTRVRTLDVTDTVDIKVDSDDMDVSNPVITSSLSSTSSAAPALIPAGPITSSVERLLASINDLLERRLRSDAELRHQTDMNQQMMNEWMIAAAVLDRICFIVFSITFVFASLVFALLFLFHP